MFSVSWQNNMIDNHVSKVLSKYSFETMKTHTYYRIASERCGNRASELAMAGKAALLEIPSGCLYIILSHEPQIFYGKCLICLPSRSRSSRVFCKSTAVRVRLADSRAESSTLCASSKTTI